MSGFGALYHVGVGINLKDHATAGLRKMVGELRATGKEAERLKKEISNIGMRFGGAKNLDDAKRRMAEMAKMEADIRSKSATAERTQDINRYRRQLQSIDLTKKQLRAQMQGFAIEEKAERERKVMADQAALREQRAAIQRQSREERTQRSYRAYLTDVERQQQRTQKAAERSAEKVARQEAMQQRAGQNYSRWWSAALDRQDVHRTRQQNIEKRHEERRQSRQAKQNKKQITAAGSAINSAANTAGVAGFALLGSAAYATEQAAKYQQTSVEALMPLGYARWKPNVQRKHIAEIQAAASAASQATGYFTEQQIIEGMQSIATNGANQLGISTFLKLTPGIAQYMDVVGRLKNEAPVDAAGQAMEYAHMIGATTPKQLTQGLNQAASLSLITGHDMATAMSTLQYLEPVAALLGKQGPLPSLALYASLDQSGQGGGHVGARTKDLIEAFTTQGSKQQRKARWDLRFRDALNADGSLDSVKMIQTLIADAKKFNKIDPKTHQSEFSNLIKRAVGEQALPTALWLADPSGNGLNRYLKNQSYIQGATKRNDLSVVQSTLKSTAIGQQKSAQTQVQNLVVEFGKTGVPIMEKFYRKSLDWLHIINAGMQSHPKASSQAFNGVIDVGAFLIAFRAVEWFAKGLFDVGKRIIDIAKGTRAAFIELRTWGPKIAEFGRAVASWGPKAMPALQAVRSALIPVLEGLAALGAGPLIAVAASIGALIAVLKNAQWLEDQANAAYDKVFGQGAHDWSQHGAAPSGSGAPSVVPLGNTNGGSTIGSVQLNFALPPGTTEDHRKIVMRKVADQLNPSRSVYGRTGDNPTSSPLQSRLSYGYVPGGYH